MPTSKQEATREQPDCLGSVIEPSRTQLQKQSERWERTPQEPLQLGPYGEPEPWGCVLVNFVASVATVGAIALGVFA